MSFIPPPESPNDRIRPLALDMAFAGVLLAIGITSTMDATEEEFFRG